MPRLAAESGFEVALQFRESLKVDPFQSNLYRSLDVLRTIIDDGLLGGFVSFSLGDEVRIMNLYRQHSLILEILAATMRKSFKHRRDFVAL